MYKNFQFTFYGSGNSEDYVCIGELWFWDGIQRLKGNRLTGEHSTWATANGRGNVRYAGTPDAINYATSNLFDDDTTTSWCSANHDFPVSLDVTFDQPIQLSRYAIQASQQISHPSPGHTGPTCLALAEPCLAATELGGFSFDQQQCRADAESCATTAATLSGRLSEEESDIATCNGNSKCVYSRATWPLTAAPTSWILTAAPMQQSGNSGGMLARNILDRQHAALPWTNQEARHFFPYDPVDNPIDI